MKIADHAHFKFSKTKLGHKYVYVKKLDSKLSKTKLGHKHECVKKLVLRN